MFALHVSRDCDMVAVKGEDCGTTDCYMNWTHPTAGVDCMEISASSGAQSGVINLKKEEGALDSVCVKDERTAGNVSDSVSQYAGEFDLKSDDIVHLQNVDGKYQIDDENVDDSRNCGLPEERAYPNVGLSVDETASAISREQTQTIKVKTEESATSNISVNAGVVSDCSVPLALKPEEVDLGCDFVEDSQNLCSDDDNSDENSERTQSQELPTDKTLKCPFCDKGYSDKSTLRKHLLTHTGELPYPCTLCEKKFSKKSQLNRHMLTHPVDRPYECNQCQKSFNQEINLNNHMLTHEKKFACNVCERKFTTNHYLRAHMISHVEKSHTCDICEKKFPSESKLVKHRVIHTGEKKYTCDVCGNKFGHWGGLRNHMFIHTGDKPHACHICNRKFAMKQALTKHIMIHNGKKKSYKCNICEQELTDTPLFVQHMITHTGGRPYKCKVCQKEFKETVDFNEHVLMHKGIRPYACNVCSKTYCKKKYLLWHMKEHAADEKNYNCELCGKKIIYTNRQRFIKKKCYDCLLTDGNEKLHVCAICARPFSFKGRLETHMLSHTGEKPFECKICGNKFALKHSRKKHMLKQHGKESQDSD